MADGTVIIDFEHLDRQTMGDRELAVEVMQIFVDQLQSRMTGLDADDPDLKKIAHSIKGSARGVGAWALAQQAERLELATKAICDELEELKTIMHASCEQARSYLAGTEKPDM